jgi:glycosyltransferase involved in cell wall biosynthesis
MQVTHDLDYGGLQQVIVNICKSIDREKFDASVLCLRNLGAYVPEVESLGVKVHFIPQKESGVDYFSFLKVAEVFRREKVDIIHTHNTQPLVDGTLGALLSGVKTIVHTDHARDFPDKKRYMFAEWCMSHFVYKMVGVSDHTVANLRRYEHIPLRKLITIPNGIDGRKYQVEVDKHRKKEELGIHFTGPIIGLGVRIAEQKGITYLLQAMPIILKRFPDLSLVIAGDGHLVDALKQEARDLNINEHVFFIGPRLDMPELLKLFDLYVLPSLWEGLPMVLLEAMAAGCPIVATDVGGNAQAITDGYNGTLVEARNPQKFADAVTTLLSRKDIRETYIHNALRVFTDRFSADIMTRKYEQIYLGKI